MWNQKPCFRFEIDNFSEKKDVIKSHTFVSGGCEWYLYFYPKGDSSICDDHLSLFLAVANYKSLGSGWKRRANFYFSVLNQSDEELCRSPIGREQYPFNGDHRSALGFITTLPLSKFQEEGFLKNDKLIIEVFIKVVEAVDGEGGDVSKKNEIGSKDYASQVNLVRKIFAEHPEIAQEFKPKNQVLMTEYMNVLRNACRGFNLDWLKSKLGEFSLESKKADDALGEVPLENKKADDADGSRVQQLEEHIKNLELMKSSIKMLEEISLERKKSYGADGSRVQQLEERVKNLELMENGLRLDSLKSKLEEVSLEKKNAEVDGSQVHQLEDRVKNLELMVSDLKVEMDKEKAKSSADGFLLVE